MDNPIIKIITNLVNEGLHPTAVSAIPDNGIWSIEVVFSDFVALGEGCGPVNVDRQDMPAGVSVSGFERYQDHVEAIGAESREIIEQWMIEAARLGKAPDFAWIGNRCVIKPIEWLKEPTRSLLLKKYEVQNDDPARKENVYLMSEFCEHCEKELEEGEGPLCESCQADADWCKWRDETVEAVEALAAKYGWDIERTGGWGKRSWYYTLTKECDQCVLGLDGECECKEIKLRISNHATAYCTEEISLAYEGGGDDHTIEQLEERMK